MNFLAYADGSNDLIDICNIIDVPMEEIYKLVKLLLSAGVIEEITGLVSYNPVKMKDV